MHFSLGLGLGLVKLGVNVMSENSPIFHHFAWRWCDDRCWIYMPGVQISHDWLYVLHEFMENIKTPLNLSSTVNLPHTNPKTPRLIHSHNDFAIFSQSLLLSTSITSSLYSSLSAITLDILPKWDESKGRGEERRRGPYQLLGNQNAIVLHKW